ncbi:hypothetical protein [Methylomonas sp. HYX-M1]|uniref:hypothetical protein n=1 Tax=Methylomonas sp. HYX-M1 TaxID=3139307 RepID=UPI00345C0363
MKQTHDATKLAKSYRLRLALKNRFPNWSQWFWSWLTGIALPGQEPLIVWRPETRALALFFQIILAASLGTSLINHIVTRIELWT